MAQNEQSSELHPHFPSGEWEGIYIYGTGTRETMEFVLNFKNGVVSGHGNDPVGIFFWKGVYSTETLTCQMVKYYGSHVVHYDGHADENGIWGKWSIPNDWGGGFHIWPKKAAEEEEEVAEIVEVKQVPVLC